MATPDSKPDDLRNYPFVMPGISVSRIAFIADIDRGMRIDEPGGGVLPSIAVSSFRSASDIVAATDAIRLGHPTQIAHGIAFARTFCMVARYGLERRFQLAIGRYASAIRSARGRS